MSETDSSAPPATINSALTHSDSDGKIQQSNPIVRAGADADLSHPSLQPDASANGVLTNEFPQAEASAASSALGSELAGHISSALKRLSSSDAGSDSLIQHGVQAIGAFDVLVELIAAGDPDIKALLRDTRDELFDSYLAARSGRLRIAFAMLRGVMEGLFTSLYYRQQAISLNLWASNRNFVMVHNLLSGDHEFRLYYKMLFDDEGFQRQYPRVVAKHVFDEAIQVYDYLSTHIHKKKRTAECEVVADFTETLERVFQIFLCFLEREEEIASINFPKPLTFARKQVQGKRSKK